jgi:hypothetical protein
MRGATGVGGKDADPNREGDADRQQALTPAQPPPGGLGTARVPGSALAGGWLLATDVDKRTHLIGTYWIRTLRHHFPHQAIIEGQPRLCSENREGMAEIRQILVLVTTLIQVLV